MPDTKWNENFMSTVNNVNVGSKSVLIGSILLNFVFAGAFTYMVQWIHSMQMIVHLPMMRILVPPNVSCYFQTVVPIITFDVLPADYSTELILNFDRDSQEKIKDRILGQMQDLGYENHNLIQILGSLGLLTFFSFICIMLYACIFYPLSARYGINFKITRAIRRSMVYNLPISVCQSGYFEFIIGIYLNIDQQIKTLSGEWASLISAYYCFFLVFIWIPLGLINLLKTPLDTIKNSRKFKRKWGAFYNDVKPDSKGKLLYFTIFYLRRVFFCFVAFYLLPLTIVKVQIIMMINLLIVIYHCSFDPFISRRKNRIEVFNEVLITIITFHICFFTEFMPNKNGQVFMGWSMIYLTAVNSFFNFALIFFEGFCGIKLVVVKWHRRFRRWLDPEYMRPNKKNQDKKKEKKKVQIKPSNLSQNKSLPTNTNKKVKFAPENEVIES